MDKNSNLSSSKFPTTVKKPVDLPGGIGRKLRGSEDLADRAISGSAIKIINDGRIDLLTRTITPSNFIRNLRKSIAMIDRGLLKPNLAVVTFRISEEAHEGDVLKLSETIAQSIRDSDYFARMSTRGFWAVLHGTESECAVAVDRILRAKKKDAPIYRVQILARLSGESRLDWLARIDSIYFDSP